ncbi:MAG TPA: hypothetical protein VJM53_09100 [Burkholderiales bacterium]|nr:hypothetical protein [Burkholderiales bacterium]
MLKKVMLAAVMLAPTFAFAAPDIVIRVGGPTHVQYGHGDHGDYRHREYYGNRSEQRQRIHWVNVEQERQHDRLIQGLRSGELTPREADRLRDEQARIREMERRYLADGYFNYREFANMQDALRDSSRHILAEKSDRQDRDYRYYGRG